MLVISDFCGGCSKGGGSVKLVGSFFWMEVHHSPKVRPWSQGVVRH